MVDCKLLHHLAIAISETAENQADDVNELPNAEEAGCEELQNAGENATGIEAVDAADAEETEQGEQ
jgi:hypothetical protein